VKHSHAYILLGILVAAILIAYAPLRKAQFVNYDDDKMVYQNPKITSLSPAAIKTIFTEDHVGLYHPLVLLSYAIEYRFFQLDPAPYHMTNLVLHLLNTGLVFWIILIVSHQPLVAFVTALFFGIHPLHVESVAWVTERKDTLYAFFFLASLVAYLLYKRKPSPAAYGVSLVLFICSLLSKPMAVTLPFILIACDYLIENKITKKDITEKIPFFAVAVLFGLLTVLIHYGSKDVSPRPPFALWQKFFISSYGFIFYIGKMFLPVKLSCIYQYPDNIYTRLPAIFAAAPFIVTALTAAVVFSVRYTKKIIFGFLFYAVTVAPVLQFLPAGGEAVPADRYTYIPLIGLFYIAAEGCGWAWKRNRQLRVLVIIALTALTVILGHLTFTRCLVWQDSITLWTDVLGSRPRTGVAYSNRGSEYFLRGDHVRAVADFTEALRLNPGYAEVYNNRGVLYSTRGDNDKAIADFTRAILLKPAYAASYDNRGLAYHRKGLLHEALRDFTKAIELHPRLASAYNHRGIVYNDQGLFDKAIEDYNTALALQPAFADACHNRGVAYFMKRDFDRAWQDVREVRRLGDRPNPRFIELLKQQSGREE
jgi:tetratricopeptide (TPR) repeat protein